MKYLKKFENLDSYKIYPVTITELPEVIKKFTYNNLKFKILKKNNNTSQRFLYILYEYIDKFGKSGYIPASISNYSYSISKEELNRYGTEINKEEVNMIIKANKFNL